MAYFVSSGTWNVDSSDHSRTAGLSSRCRGLSAAAGLTGAISSQHILQIASEDFVAWCVDERVHTEAEVSQWTGQHKSVAVQARNLPDVQQSNLSVQMCFTRKLLQQCASKAAYRPNSTGSLGPVPRNFLVANATSKLATSYEEVGCVGPTCYEEVTMKLRETGPSGIWPYRPTSREKKTCLRNSKNKISIYILS